MGGYVDGIRITKGPTCVPQNDIAGKLLTVDTDSTKLWLQTWVVYY